MASNKYYKIINKETGEDLEVCGEAGYHHAFFSYDRDEAERTFDILSKQKVIHCGMINL